jgi:hypothetical protein
MACFSSRIALETKKQKCWLNGSSFRIEKLTFRRMAKITKEAELVMRSSSVFDRTVN